MKARGIIMQADSVRGILAGRKTQTRRLVFPKLEDQGRPRFLALKNGIASFGDSIPDDPIPLEVQSRYGVAGDRLWVRESFTHIRGNGVRVWYRADGEPKDRDGNRLPWRPLEPRWASPLYMRRQESRLTLELLEVRIERLQLISEEDAMAEGVTLDCLSGLGDQPIIGTTKTKATHPYTLAYAMLWDQINGDRALWLWNPWVWVLRFRRLEADQIARAV